MGRAMLIIVSGLLVAMGFTYTSMSDQRQMLASQSSNTASEAITKNLAFTGIQFAIQEFGDNGNNSFGPQTMSFDHGDVTIEVQETVTDQKIRITSTGKMDGQTNQITAIYDISEKEELVPTFRSGLGITTDNFIFNLGGSAKIDGNYNTSECKERPGVSVINNTAKEQVGTNTNIDGTPDDEAKVDPDLEFQGYQDLIARLEDTPEAETISGNYKGDMGTEDDPGTFFVEDYTKLSGGISEGYGIMVIRKDAELDYEGDLDIRGNFTFNGLVIFENAYELDAKGTPSINGSVVVGSSNDENITIDISGNVALNHDCTAKDYADRAAEQSVTPDRIYKPLSFFKQ